MSRASSANIRVVIQEEIMVKPVINISEVELQPRPAAMAATGEAAGKYDARMGMVAPRIGARKLGYNVTAVPPGKRAFPCHNHLANEEMIFVLEGSGEVRIGDATHPIRVGDFVAFPPGGRDTAHQVINSGTAELKYLAVSTRIYPEVCDYPDSGKFGVLAERPSGPDGTPEMFRYIGRESGAVNYWDGE